METIVKFAIYDSMTSTHKRTTYRIVKRKEGYILERYKSYREGWEELTAPQSLMIKLLEGYLFKSLFYIKNRKP